MTLFSFKSSGDFAVSIEGKYVYLYWTIGSKCIIYPFIPYKAFDVEKEDWRI